MEKLNLTKLNGTIEEVEIVATFNIENNKDVNYIIYKNAISYYAAKYKVKDNNINLIHDLTKEEKEFITKVFEELKEGGTL